MLYIHILIDYTRVMYLLVIIYIWLFLFMDLFYTKVMFLLNFKLLSVYAHKYIYTTYNYIYISVCTYFLLVTNSCSTLLQLHE